MMVSRRGAECEGSVTADDRGLRTGGDCHSGRSEGHGVERQKTRQRFPARAAADVLGDALELDVGVCFAPLFAKWKSSALTGQMITACMQFASPTMWPSR